MSGLAVGIDLGTTYSCVAVYRNNNVEIIANELGERTTPSYVAFAGNERLVGKSAKNQAARNHSNTIFDAKRLIGRKFDDSVVQSDMKFWPFTIVSGDRKKAAIQADFRGETHTFSPEQISAFILMSMKRTAENFLGTEIKDAVVTVPAYFNDAQRQATKVAGQIAGLNVLRMINEPTAAAIAYGIGKEGTSTVLIFDLGGGTFDVSLLEIDGGLFTVMGTAGDTHLGGEDFDNRLVEYFVKDFKRKHRIDISNNQRALRRLRTVCERAKRTLSSQPSASVEVESLAEGIDYRGVITRARFESLCNDYFQGCLNPVRQVLTDTKMQRSEIDEVIMVGGSSRIPKVRQLISQFFGGKQLNHTINPDEAVAHGAAVQAALLMGNTDEVISGFVLEDITPLSLGIETHDGMMKVIIPRNSPLPINKKEMFSTSVENQSAVQVTVFEGERAECKQNNQLGKFILGNIPKAPRAVPKIIVTFNLDLNGTLTVSASEKSSGTPKMITIKNDKGRLDTKEVERMIKEAAQFKEEDENIRRVATVRNKLSGFIGHIGRTLKDPKYRPVMSEEDRGILSKAGHAAIQWFKAESKSAAVEDFVSQLKTLADVCVPVLKRVEEASRKQEKSKEGEKDD